MDEMQEINGQDAQGKMQKHTHRTNQTTQDKLPKHTTTQGEYDHLNTQDRDIKITIINTDKVTSQNSHMKAWVYNIINHHNTQHNPIATQNRRQRQDRPDQCTCSAGSTDSIPKNSRGRAGIHTRNQSFQE
jgi:hypothetical protein